MKHFFLGGKGSRNSWENVGGNPITQTGGQLRANYNVSSYNNYSSNKNLPGPYPISLCEFDHL